MQVVRGTSADQVRELTAQLMEKDDELEVLRRQLNRSTETTISLLRALEEVLVLAEDARRRTM